MAAHLTQQERIDFNFEAETRTETWQGSFDELNRMIDGISVGGPATGDGVYTGAVLSRREGGRGTLELAVRILNGYSWWGFSFSEISKPVKTWLATKITNKDALNAELAKISLWEDQLNRGEDGQANYYGFRYDSTHALTGHTLTLAQKIVQGIDSYSVYTPVATCRRTQNEPFTDGLNSIGKYVTRLVSAAGAMTEKTIPPLAAVSVTAEAPAAKPPFPELTYATAFAWAYVLRSDDMRRVFRIKAKGSSEYCFVKTHGAGVEVVIEQNVDIYRSVCIFSNGER